MSDNKLKVGIAGYGVVGKRRRIYIDQNQHLKTVAVSDITFEREGIAEFARGRVVAATSRPPAQLEKPIHFKSLIRR